ncbi:hypothetical protein [Bradyrhizobium elkanii]
MVYASAANLTEEEERLSNLVNDILESERALHDLRPPRYPYYGNIAVLNRFVGVYSNFSIQRTWAKCRIALAVVAEDWLQFERHALKIHDRAKNKPPTESLGENFQEQNIRLRIERLELICSLLANIDRPAIPLLDSFASTDYPVDWLYYAMEHDGAVGLAHLTALPQSKLHDEYLFLRTIHLNEICFWAVITGIRAATQSFQRREYPTTFLALRDSNFFAEFLLRIFSVFKTMPIESFSGGSSGFRDATGEASAIQSEKYQHLEIISRGLSAEKRKVLQNSERYPELQWLADWHPPPEATLSGLAQALAESEIEGASSMMAEIYRLDRSLQSWRNLHLGIARDYLPKEAVGTGEQGVSYLEKHYRSPSLFGSRSSGTTIVRNAVSSDAFVSSADFSGLQIAFIISRNVSASKLIETSEIMGKQAEERINQLSHETTYPLSRLFRFYDPIFARYGRQFPLKRELTNAMRSGLPPDIVQRLLLSLELSGGLLIGLLDGSQVKFPIRVTTAAAGSEFISITGETIPLKANELILADESKTIASYVQGPDKRTSVQVTDSETARTFRSLVFVVFGAPALPEADFGAALDFVRTAAFSMAGEPEVCLVRTQYA